MRSPRPPDDRPPRRFAPRTPRGQRTECAEHERNARERDDHLLPLCFETLERPIEHARHKRDRGEFRRGARADVADAHQAERAPPEFRAGRRMAPEAPKKITVAEVEEIVPLGSLDPDQIHTPGVYVKRIFKAEKSEKRIEQRTVRKAA